MMNCLKFVQRFYQWLQKLLFMVILTSLLVQILNLLTNGVTQGQLVREHHYKVTKLSSRCDWQNVKPEVRRHLVPIIPNCNNFGEPSQWVSYNQLIECYWDSYESEMYFCQYQPLQVSHSSFYFLTKHNYLYVIHVEEVMEYKNEFFSSYPNNIRTNVVMVTKPQILIHTLNSSAINSSFEEMKKNQGQLTISQEYIKFADIDRSDCHRT